MVTIIFYLILAGFCTYLILTYIPMPQIFKTLIIAVVAICAVLYILNFFGIHVIPMEKLK